MSHWESIGKSDEWYTPAYVFDALGCRFDLDVAHPNGHITHVPASRFLSVNSLDLPWSGFVWMNPPYSGRNGIEPWMRKFFKHGNGIALTPDRTSAPWWQESARNADAILFVAGKIKFIRPDGMQGKSPSNGTTLMASGKRGVQALQHAMKNGLGFLVRPEDIFRDDDYLTLTFRKSESALTRLADLIPIEHRKESFDLLDLVLFELSTAHVIRPIPKSLLSKIQSVVDEIKGTDA